MLNSRLRADEGFTLVELLVTILIVGILAAIALPAFLHQRSKAQDAEAKTMVGAAATAMVVWETDTGSFSGATGASLGKIEPALQQALELDIQGTKTTFSVSVDSQAGGTYTIERDADGTVRRTCAPAGEGGCADTPDANGNSW
jgi:type IV pilus assembly protein PilA